MLNKEDEYLLKKGEHINFGEGESDDYTEFGEREILKDFDIKEQANIYLNDHDKISIFNFLEWLDKQGFTKHYEIKTFYTGSGFYDGEDFNWFGIYSDEDVEKKIDDWVNSE